MISAPDWIRWILFRFKVLGFSLYFCIYWFHYWLTIRAFYVTIFVWWIYHSTNPCDSQFTIPMKERPVAQRWLWYTRNDISWLLCFIGSFSFSFFLILDSWIINSLDELLVAYRACFGILRIQFVISLPWRSPPRYISYSVYEIIIYSLMKAIKKIRTLYCFAADCWHSLLKKSWLFVNFFIPFVSSCTLFTIKWFLIFWQPNSFPFHLLCVSSITLSRWVELSPNPCFNVCMFRMAFFFCVCISNWK